MGATIQFIRKVQEFAGPPSADPENQRQWVPRRKWNPTNIKGGMGRNSDIGSETPMCKKCGASPVRSRSPKRKGKIETVLRPAGSRFEEGMPRITVFNTTKIYAPNGLCIACNIKKQKKIGRQTSFASAVKKEGWLV